MKKRAVEGKRDFSSIDTKKPGSQLSVVFAMEETKGNGAARAVPSSCQAGDGKNGRRERFSVYWFVL